MTVATVAVVRQSMVAGTIVWVIVRVIFDDVTPFMCACTSFRTCCMFVLDACAMVQ